MSSKEQKVVRKYDLVLWGASGFTGLLCAEYLARVTVDGGRADALQWAIAGRSAEKLAQIKQHLLKINPKLNDLGLIVAESKDRASLDEMVLQTRVVLSTVGPFALYGSLLVELCVQRGVHYTDITGETNWVRNMIDLYNDQAKENKALIVPMCGFDSIPSDLGTYFVVTELKKRHGADFVINEVTCLHQMKASFSGGTMASALAIFEQLADNPQLRAAVRHPYTLNPKPLPTPRKEDRDQFFARYDPLAKSWTAPFPLSASNARVVRRSNALLSLQNKGYGPNFVYREGLKTNSWWSSSLLVMFLGIFMLLLSFRWTRSIVKKFVPNPGSGPSAEKRATFWFVTRFYARGQATQSKTNKTVQLVASLKGGDPGYDETAKMVCEAALLLALERNQLHPHGGVLTPAVCFGDALFPYLSRAGLPFLVDPLLST